MTYLLFEYTLSVYYTLCTRLGGTMTGKRPWFLLLWSLHYVGEKGRLLQSYRHKCKMATPDTGYAGAHMAKRTDPEKANI